MKSKKLFASTVAVFLLLGLGACGSDTDKTDKSDSSSESSKTESNKSDSKDKATTAPKSTVDRTTLPWNDDVPADFPLEDIPLPKEGTFDYAEKTDNGKDWNVMISDVPIAEHEAWLNLMKTEHKVSPNDDMTFYVYADSGASYTVFANVFDRTDDTVIMAYRINP